MNVRVQERGKVQLGVMDKESTHFQSQLYQKGEYLYQDIISLGPGLGYVTRHKSFCIGMSDCITVFLLHLFSNFAVSTSDCFVVTNY